MIHPEWDNEYGHSFLTTEIEQIHDGIFEVIARRAPVAMLVTDTQGTIVFANEHIASLLLHDSPNDLIGGSITPYITPYRDRESNMRSDFMERLYSEGEVFNHDTHLSRADGSTYEADVSASIIYNDQKEPVYIIGIFEDITKKKQIERALWESKERHRLLIENIAEGIVIADTQEIITYANSQAVEIFQQDRDTIVGRSLIDFLDDEEKTHILEETEIRKQGKSSTYITSIRLPNGEKRWISMCASPCLGPKGEFLGSYGFFRDVTGEHVQEEELRFASFHDALTGLYNRNYVEIELDRLQKGRHFPVTIIFCDVDDLKKVNDTNGHEAGDEYLRWVANILQMSFRADDIVSRWGGDEFVIVLPDTDEQRAFLILNRLKEKYPEFPVSTGCATTNGERDLRNTRHIADNRMYEEKKRRKQEK